MIHIKHINIKNSSGWSAANKEEQELLVNKINEFMKINNFDGDINIKDDDSLLDAIKNKDDKKIKEFDDKVAKGEVIRIM